ncbi:hypothetical protein TRVL_00305 [Trypanosoma vivax]|nr:hypothetical protein TRVL_00305 [Trypanosoma vivax]
MSPTLGVPYCLLALCIAIFRVAEAGAISRGFASDVPGKPNDVMYHTYFRNYDTAYPCVLRGVIRASSQTSSSNFSSDFWGCVTGSSNVHAHSLFLLRTDEASQMHADGCQPTQLLKLIGSIKLPSENTTNGLGIVVATREVEGAGALKEEDAPRTCDITCILTAVSRYNQLNMSERPPAMPNITAVAFSDDNKKCKFSVTGDAYEDALLLPTEVRSAYGFVVLYFPSVDGTNAKNGGTTGLRSVSGSSDSSGDWSALLKVAAFNRRRWTEGNTYPHRILETRNGMPLASRDTGARENATNDGGKTELVGCLGDEPLPTCFPVGGWTVWATNADTNWEWRNNSMSDVSSKTANTGGGVRTAGCSSFVKKTRKGAIALMVASTAVSLVHGVTPGADCPASGIVAILSLMDALQRAINADRGVDGTLKARDVYAFFFPGEHLGSAGSSRFVADALGMDCEADGVSACMGLAYNTSLNFTTVDFDAIDTFFVVDQVALDGAPLFYHVDGRVDAASKQSKDNTITPQKRAEKVLESRGVRRASTTRLPYSPITTLLDLIPNADKGNKTFISLTRYNTTYINRDVFTVLDRANANRSKTVPKGSHPARNETVLSAGAIADAADALLAVLVPSLATVNRTLVTELFDCFSMNVNCSFISPQRAESNATVVPDYSVNMMSGPKSKSFTVTQKAIRTALVRIGWANTLISPAFSRGLKVPQGRWDSGWALDEKWLIQYSKNDERYALHVLSRWRQDIGARGAFVESKKNSWFLFFLSVVVSLGGLVYLKMFL